MHKSVSLFVFGLRVFWIGDKGIYAEAEGSAVF